ncbi:MAG: DNA adenine methylase [Candidatus Poribacteria bacterium]|nr:DNA adenine methylase [Candidatus Poribacteria bacterium]
MAQQLELIPLHPVASPFLKWAGGKTQLLKQFEPLFPPKFERYIESFIGGGAVFFHLFSFGRIREARLSDNNEELINCYQVVKTDVSELISLLKTHQKCHNEDYYYHMRSLQPIDLSLVERAARILYLNKTCFNGLYRVNRKGQFNVPIGSYENPAICNEDALTAASRVLENVTILHADFEECTNAAQTNDFVYLDPPYSPISETANFTQYTKDGFSGKDQQRLATVFEQLTTKNCYAMLSNSDCEPIRQLYQKHHIETVRAKRAINSKATARGAIGEIVVRNY